MENEQPRPNSEVHGCAGLESLERKFPTKRLQVNCRCFNCYNIIAVGISTDGNLVMLDLDSKPHSCLNLNIIDESDKPTPSRLKDELFLQLIRSQYRDQTTGELNRGYLEQAKDLIYRIPVYNPPPVL